MLDGPKVDELVLGNKRDETVGLLKGTRGELISKLTIILNSKIDKEITEFLQNDKNTQVSSKTSNTIITFFLQMVEITDEYLVVE